MKHINLKKEEGITILLAVMMISAISIITITVAAFVIQELRNSRASTLTEPAIIAAETASEQGIFEIKRGTFSTDCASAQYTQINGIDRDAASTLIKKCISTAAAQFQITAGEPLDIYLYDPTNINGNTCLEDDAVCPSDGNGTGTQLYTSLEVRHISGSFNVNVDMDTLDGVDVADSNVSPGNTGTFLISRNIIGSDDERLKITLEPTSGTATVIVSTTGMYSGLPDYRTLDAEGCVSLTNISDCDSVSETYKRRINVTLPQ